MNFQGNTLAIICGGGPAPGINNVIASVTIEARNNGWDVLGIYDGFSHLATANKKVIPLTIDMVSRIHKEGGSIIRTSRFNPTKSEAILRTVVENLVDLGVTHIVTIGGDDTAYAAHKVSEFAREKLGLNIRFVHVPKTIDNDLPLPEGLPTFGYETARALGAELVMNLMEDAKTMGRWFLVVTMGRVSGHLALGIGKSASATLTIIPEEFEGETISLKHVIDIMSGTIIKRLALERDHGVIVAAEGLISKMLSHELSAIDSIEKDEYGHVRYAEINFSDVLKRQLNGELKKMDIPISVQNKEIGYEVRCAPPNPFDVEYTRNLGYGAFKFLADGGTNAIITIQNNQLTPIMFDDIVDPTTGKMKIRTVDINSLQYRIAREYMIRLTRDDFESKFFVNKMARIANMTPQDFIEKYGYLVGLESE
ncbi:diphosphate--fructose-6-phosphate 1-phosphotransferase [Acetomicrobium sp.]|jgi:6-phosphofructokinase|uniref:diphosphate--fructose-6-phosphate 1-phosphotransferase n=1 Tax=Acetomicrobium sp. TaxID=1872099 RepID=UPI002FCC7D05